MHGWICFMIEGFPVLLIFLCFLWLMYQVWWNLQLHQHQCCHRPLWKRVKLIGQHIRWAKLEAKWKSIEALSISTGAVTNFCELRANPDNSFFACLWSSFLQSWWVPTPGILEVYLSLVDEFQVLDFSWRLYPQLKKGNGGCNIWVAHLITCLKYCSNWMCMLENCVLPIKKIFLKCF